MGENMKLSSKLAELLNAPPISIELLPGDGAEWLADAPAEHAPFLFIDRNLGVPQKIAYKAYLEGVARFRAVRTCLLAHARGPALRAPGYDGIDGLAAEALAASAVLLLVNPAHQSALNARRRLVQMRLHDARSEMAFVGALLTLREGAKQAGLWHHRRWLLRRIYSRTSLGSQRGVEGDGDGDGEDTLRGVALDAEAFRAEGAAVERACGVYPRNYYAWAHRFLCAEALVARARPPGGPPAPGDAESALAEVLAEERAWVRVWIERHVSDYSAVQYRCRLETLVRDACAGWGGEEGAELEWGRGVDTCAHALEMVRAYPAHESLWLYLRGALLLCVGSADDGMASRAFAEELLSSGSDGGESAKVEIGPRGHAVRFLAWEAWPSRERSVDETLIQRIAAATCSDSEGELGLKIDSRAALLSYLDIGTGELYTYAESSR